MKKKGTINILIVSAALVFSVACNNKTKILSGEKMAAILHDTYLAESMYDLKYSEFASNDKRIAITENIFEKHDVTRAEFDSSLVWYSDHAESFVRINDSVVSSLNQDLKGIEHKQTKSSNLNSNIIDSYFFISNDRPLLRFNIDSTEILKYPNFEINFKTLGFDKNFNVDFVVNYIYSDTMIVDSHKILTNNLFRSNIPNNGQYKALKSINGYIYADPILLREKTPLIYNIEIKK